MTGSFVLAGRGSGKEVEEVELKGSDGGVGEACSEDALRRYFGRYGERERESVAEFYSQFGHEASKWTKVEVEVLFSIFVRLGLGLGLF